jgi:type I restriction enzyme S subunit
MEVKPGYKQTEVGVIPEEWDVCLVRQKGEVLTGKALAVGAPGAQRPYLRTKNVFDGRIDIDDVLTMPMTDEQFAQFEIRNGDVLLNEGQSIELVGRCALYQDEYPEPCAIQNALLRFRARQGVSEKFASYLFRHCQHTGVFARIALQTTSVAHLGGSRFEKLRLAWPTAVEQRAIAAALSDVDALLGGLDRLIAKKRDLKQAARQQLLTGQTRLPGFSGEWSELEFGEIASIRNAKVVASSVPSGTQCVELESIGGEGSGRLLMSTDATGMSSKYSFKKGDVLFGRLRAYLRKYWHATFDGICSTEIWPLVARDMRLCGAFLHLLVQTDDFVNAAGVSYGTHMPRSDWTVLKKLVVRLPPLPEQTAIAAVLSDMDAELAALEARRDKTRDLKQAMMQELLSGKTRLVKPETAHA